MNDYKNTNMVYLQCDICYTLNKRLSNEEIKSVTSKITPKKKRYCKKCKKKTNMHLFYKRDVNMTDYSGDIKDGILYFNSDMYITHEKIHSDLIDINMKYSVDVYYIDVFYNLDIVKKYNVTHVPTIILLKNNKIKYKATGFEFIKNKLVECIK